jgi:acyl-CoA reductase-like NAD-dependent aldehyde dehydrogenase
MTKHSFVAVSPVDGRTLFERDFLDWDELKGIAKSARVAFSNWSDLKLEERASYVKSMIAFLEENADAIARDVANSIGRPLHLANELP